MELHRRAIEGLNARDEEALAIVDPSIEIHLFAEIEGARLLHGLSDESRLGILAELRGGERRVSELVKRTGLSQPNVSKHLACLWGCGLVARERRGREVFYRSIEGLDELLAAADAVLERAGETIGACPLTDVTIYRGVR